MEKLHILITAPLEEADLEQIAAVDPRVEVGYAMEEVRAELGIIPSMVTPWSRSMCERELTREEASETLNQMLAHTEVIFGWRLPLNLLSRAPRLKWVQGIGAGVDLLAGSTGLLQSDVIVTSSSGIHNTNVVEFALCLLLMLAKKAPRFLANQEASRWESFVPSALKGKTVGVVGLGKIGSDVARLARAFRTKVLAMEKFAATREKDVAGVDELFPSGEFLQMLPECDFVILTLPLTPETRGLIGEAELRVMKPTAYIINVARGPIIKQEALLQALKEGWIAGAALDVFETEPLPPESELWRLPNIIISPHLAGSPMHTAPLTEFFCSNLRRFLAGEELLNLVDKPG